MTPLRFLTGTMADTRLAARRLAASPLFTIFAILSLAVGVGVTTAVYSVVHALFLKGLPIHDAARVAFVVTPFDGRMARATVSLPDFRDLQRAQRSFETLSASTSLSPAVGSFSATELLLAEVVDGSYFLALGIRADLGRTLQPADEAAAAPVVVLSAWLWRTRFGSNPSVVGRTIRISGQPFEVIGVTPPTFDGLNRIPPTRLWIPMGSEPPVEGAPRVAASTRDQRRLSVFGRLRPPATIAAASAEVGAVSADLDAAFPLQRDAISGERPERRAWAAKTVTDIEAEDRWDRRLGLTLVALVALVLVVACTNLANLVLARGAVRQQELTVRSALGAPRWRMVREQVIESAMLAIGGAIGSALVFRALRLLMETDFYFVPPPPNGGGHVMLSIQPALETSALAVALGAVLVSLVVFGLEPAIQLTRSADLRGTLAATGGGLGAPRVKRQRRLLRYQVSISVGFFIIATMFVKYTITEARHDSGVDLDPLGVAVLNIRAQQWDAARVRRTLERLLDEARKESALQAISVTTGMPFGIRTPMPLVLRVPGTNTGGFSLNTVAATSDFFATIGVPIIRGRGFEPRDYANAEQVLVISEFTARTMLGTSDAVGQRLVGRSRDGVDELFTVIGVARDTDVGQILGEPKLFAYRPLVRYEQPRLLILARATDAKAAMAALRQAMRRAEPDLAVDLLASGRDVLSGPYVFIRAAGLSALSLGAITLMLAMVGLFGIQSHVVAHRTREIGVRMSVGATAGQIRRMVLKDGYLPVLDGLAFGLLIGVAGRAIIVRYLEIDVSIIDPWMVGVVPIPMFLSAFCACILPAHRASRVDPNVALRHI